MEMALLSTSILHSQNEDIRLYSHTKYSICVQLFTLFIDELKMNVGMERVQ